MLGRSEQMRILNRASIAAERFVYQRVNPFCCAGIEFRAVFDEFATEPEAAFGCKIPLRAKKARQEQRSVKELDL